jgi:hypothetical protein
MKDFENEYGDRVTVSYYWAGKDNEIMQALDVKYVPTILNGDNESIDLKLPEDVDTTGLSNEDLRNVLLENIYNKQEIEMGFEELRYILTSFRTKKTYLIFHISQLVLSVAIIIVALTSKAHFKTPSVLILEFILFLTLAFDL